MKLRLLALAALVALVTAVPLAEMPPSGHYVIVCVTPVIRHMQYGVKTVDYHQVVFSLSKL